MSSTDPSNPAPRLKASEAAVLQYLRDHGDEDGCCPRPRTQIASDLAIATSTVQLAIKALIAAGHVEAQVNRGGGVPNAYCVLSAPTDPLTDDRPMTDRSIDRPIAESVTPLVREHAPPRSLPLPTPSHGVSGNLIPEGTERPTDNDRPISESVGPESVGRLIPALVADAARAAGRPVVAHLGRVGKAALDLAAAGEDVLTLRRAAIRVGVAGTADLRTAVEAVKEGRVLPGGAGTPPAEDARTASCIRMILGTWPRAQIDAALWEEELGRVQERFLLAAVRAIAKSGAEFPPTWGQVYATARRVGEPIIGAERSERARQAELARDRERAS